MDSPSIKKLQDLLVNFEEEIQKEDIRQKVLALIPIYEEIKSLGSSLIPLEIANSARDRILVYFRKYPCTIISGDEIMIISGISEWARRVRELRVQYGWRIVNGISIKEMIDSGDPIVNEIDLSIITRGDYILLSENQDRLAAHRWHVANQLRKKSGGVKNKILEYFQENIGEEISGDELRYVANDKTEWARRVRELRTEEGWPIVTRQTGRPDLPIGIYILENNRQLPIHDRKIKDDLRIRILERDNFQCVKCGWSQSKWTKDDPRNNLEIHHIKPHSEGGLTILENLITLCNICHDIEHRKKD